MSSTADTYDPWAPMACIWPVYDSKYEEHPEQRPEPIEITDPKELIALPVAYWWTVFDDKYPEEGPWQVMITDPEWQAESIYYFPPFYWPDDDMDSSYDDMELPEDDIYSADEDRWRYEHPTYEQCYAVNEGGKPPGFW